MKDTAHVRVHVWHRGRWSWKVLIWYSICKYVCFKKICNCTMWMWVTGFKCQGCCSVEMTGLLITLLLLLYLAMWNPALVWLFPCDIMCVHSPTTTTTTTTQENETWLWIIPFRNKELAVCDAKSSGTVELAEACVSVSCYSRTGRELQHQHLVNKPCVLLSRLFATWDVIELFVECLRKSLTTFFKP